MPLSALSPTSAVSALSSLGDVARATPAWLPCARPCALFGFAWVPASALVPLEGADAAAREAALDALQPTLIRATRQRAQGLLRWHVLFLASRRFRWEEAKAETFEALARAARRGALPDAAARERLALDLGRPRLLPLAPSRACARSFIAAASVLLTSPRP